METTRIRIVLVVLAAAGLLVAGTPAVTARAATPTVHTVVMGAVDPAIPDPTPRPPASAGRSDRFEYLAYYPDDLRVHRGDSVHFRRDGFHTVTFSPAGEPRRSWIRRDETEGVSAIGFADPDPTCGHDPALPACVVTNESQVVNSGWDDLTITVDLEEGTYDYYCTLHEGMAGSIEVVPDDEPLATQAEIDTARDEQVARDTDAATALLAAGQQPAVEAVGDHLRWTVKLGDITADDRVAILRYLPSSLTIAPGDEVVFAVPTGGGAPAGRSEVATEIHTATFPQDDVVAGFGLLRYLNPACDPDDPATGLPGVPGAYPALLAGCPPGTNLELLMQPWAWRAPTRSPGDEVSSALTVHDSGLLARPSDTCRTACDAWTGERFPASGRAVFPNTGTYSFVCLVHPEWGMAGSVTVA